MIFASYSRFVFHELDRNKSRYIDSDNREMKFWIDRNQIDKAGGGSGGGRSASPPMAFGQNRNRKKETKKRRKKERNKERKIDG